MSNLQTVDFYNDPLDCVHEDGKVWVSLRRACENLGVDFRNQLTKLREKEWACVVEITTHDASGRQQELTMIDLDSLPGWLFSIDARKVKPATKEKLLRYQKECVRVLRDHFLGKPKESTPQPPLSQAELILASAQMLVDQERRVKQIETRTAIVETRTDTIETRVEAIETTQQEAVKQLTAMPAPTITIPTQSHRSLIHERIINYSSAKGIEHQKLYGRLYKAVFHRLHVNLKERAKNPKYANRPKLDILEDLGLLPQTYSLCCELFTLD